MPYRAYSELFVLAILAAWASGMSNAQVRDEFGITESTRRRILSSARRRICALLACGVSRAAVDAAIAAVGIAAIPAAHMATFGTRLAQNVRLINPHSGPRGRPSRRRGLSCQPCEPLSRKRFHLGPGYRLDGLTMYKTLRRGLRARGVICRATSATSSPSGRT